MAHDHSHDHAAHANETRLGIATVLTGGYMIAELIGGLLAGSLALLADAGHMGIDFASLLLAFIAFRIARRPANARWTYGYDRFQVLVAFANGVVLFFVAGWIVWEAGVRLLEPAPVAGSLMLWVAAGGLLVNIAAFFVLHGGDRENVNMRGALLHVMGDLLGSVGAIAAALIIIYTGWYPIDPLLSVFVSVIILGSAWRLVRDSGRILLEGAPAGLDSSAIGPALIASVPNVRDVHHVHVWSITEKMRAVTLHACMADGADAQGATRAIKKVLAEKFGLNHATVEIEYGECSDPSQDCGHKTGEGHAQATGHKHDHTHDHGNDHAHDHDHSHMMPRPA
jgi:cobalt-zinc-cadmium efflux system protein